MKLQILKTETEYFLHVVSGRKKFEFRFNDRDYKEGDILLLTEFDNTVEKADGKKGKLTHNLFICSVDFILSKAQPAFATVLGDNVILSLSDGVGVAKEQYRNFYFQAYTGEYYLRMLSNLVRTAHVQFTNLVINQETFLSMNGNKPNKDLLLAINKETGEWAIVSLFPDNRTVADNHFTANIEQIHAIHKSGNPNLTNVMQELEHVR